MLALKLSGLSPHFLQISTSIFADTFRYVWTFPCGDLDRFSVFSPTSVEPFFGCICIFRLRIFQRVEILPDVLWVCLNAPYFWIFADTIRRFPKVSWMLDVCWMIPHVSGFFWTLRYASAIVVDFFGVWWVFW